MHEDIKRFEQEAYADDKVATRDWLLSELEKQMRDEGYVPSIDNDPQFTADFLQDEQCFYVTMSVYGMYVGKEDSWLVSGISNGKRTMRPTAPSRSTDS